MSSENAHQHGADPAQITAEELLARAERDELLAVEDLRLLLAVQGTPVNRWTLRDWIRTGKIPSRRIPHAHGRRVPGAEVLATLAWRRRVSRAA